MGLFRSICYCEHILDLIAAMGEEVEKKKKKKKKKEVKEATPPPVEEVKVEKKKKKKVIKKKRSTGPKYSGPLTIFNEKQIGEFKSGFNFMDQDKDGIITKQDLLRVYDTLGVRADDAELDDMANEAPNPITFTQMLTLFAEKMAGKVDDDDLIIDSFKAYDEGGGKIDPVSFENTMKGKGDTLTDKEWTEIFPQLPRVEGDPDFICMKGVIGMLVAKKEDAEVAAVPPTPAEVPA